MTDSITTTFPKRKYRAILFDLDGTLLPMDIDEFMSAYFKSIAGFMARRGLQPEAFMAAFKEGVRAMANHDDCRTNKETFWDTFFPAYEAIVGEMSADGGVACEVAATKVTLSAEDRANVLALSEEYYATDFAHVGDSVIPNPACARAIEVLTEKGYPLVLATMPMFPRRAVEQRLRWAGVDPNVFMHITTYENSKSVKPKLSYFSDVLCAVGINGEDAIMVGNNTVEDMSALELGIDGYLVTDWLLDPVSFDMSSIKCGSMEEFSCWAETLPPYEA